MTWRARCASPGRTLGAGARWAGTNKIMKGIVAKQVGL